MKKFTKVAVVLALIFAIVGIVCVIASFAMGFTLDNLTGMVKQGRFDFAFEMDDFYEDGKGVVRGPEEKKGDVMIPDGRFQNLDIELGAGMLEIEYGNVEKVEVQEENVTGFRCYVEEGTLHIEGGIKAGVASDNGLIRVSIPKDMILDEFDLELNAGKATFNGLVANSVDIEMGAGDVELKGLDTRKLNTDVGAGKLYIELVGGETDYNYDAECGMGEIKIGTTSVGGMGGSKKMNHPGASRFMDLECGMGQIHVEFQNQNL